MLQKNASPRPRFARGGRGEMRKVRYANLLRNSMGGRP